MQQDISGQQFGDWLALAPADQYDNRIIKWLCICLGCNTDYEVSGSNLRSNKTKRCRSCSNETRTDYSSTHSRKCASYRNGAKKRGLTMELTNAEMVEMFDQLCYYCKHEPVNGIDRVDNDVGYVKSNCVPCCTTCNRAKGDLSLTDFKEWINAVSQ